MPHLAVVCRGGLASELLFDVGLEPGPEGIQKIAAGEGNVPSLGGHRLAVYRNSNGELSALSTVCTHLGCLVRWNNAEKSWDCPCHGSRFDPHGRVNGPAVTALEVKSLPPEPDQPQESEGRPACSFRRWRPRGPNGRQEAGT